MDNVGPQRKSWKRRWRIAFIVAALLCSAIVLIGLGARRVAQARIAKRIAFASPPGINQLRQVRLGGIDQWILMRGRDASAEVLLFVHGGPGVPNMPFSHLNASLEETFVVVQWDQRGAGKSFHDSTPPDAMTIDRFVADVTELSRLLASRFGKEKIILLGHSWGSIIGLKAAAESPELFHAYIGVSQVTDVMETERLIYQKTLEAARDARDADAVAELEGIGAPPFARPGDHLIACRILARFQDRSMISKRMMAMNLAGSPYYSLGDLNRFRSGMKFSLEHLWSQLETVRISSEITSLKLPVVFIQGRNDTLIPGELIEGYADRLDAPRGKRLVWIEAAGHMPHFERPDDFHRAVASTIDAADL